MKRQPINKDNYEEYFLLYVDNELTGAEKAEVEEFIDKNPGLRTELQMFLDTRLEMEEVKMDGIENLYKYDEEGVINAGNYEEFQVLMIDNELDIQQREALDEFHKQHPEALTNFEWLKKTKLQEENIVFPDKRSLYRTEKKPASIISISWIRYAAAAAVVLMAALFWINNSNEPGTDTTQVAVTGPQSQRAGEKNSPIEIQKVKEPESQTEQDNTLIAGVAGDARKKTINKNNNAGAGAEVKYATESRKAIKKTAGAETKDRIEETLASVDPQTITTVIEKNETRIRTEDLVAKTAATLNQSSSNTQPAVAMNVKTNYASEALNGISDDDDDEMIPAEEGKQKRGLRGIVRKANRIYNKVTNPDLDKQLVKVANFEIGLR